MWPSAGDQSRPYVHRPDMISYSSSSPFSQPHLIDRQAQDPYFPQQYVTPQAPPERIYNPSPWYDELPPLDPGAYPPMRRGRVEVGDTGPPPRPEIPIDDRALTLERPQRRTAPSQSRPRRLDRQPSFSPQWHEEGYPPVSQPLPQDDAPSPPRQRRRDRRPRASPQYDDSSSPLSSQRPVTRAPSPVRHRRSNRQRPISPEWDDGDSPISSQRPAVHAPPSPPRRQQERPSVSQRPDRRHRVRDRRNSSRPQLIEDYPSPNSEPRLPRADSRPALEPSRMEDYSSPEPRSRPHKSQSRPALRPSAMDDYSSPRESERRRHRSQSRREIMIDYSPAEPERRLQKSQSRRAMGPSPIDDYSSPPEPERRRHRSQSRRVIVDDYPPPERKERPERSRSRPPDSRRRDEYMVPREADERPPRPARERPSLQEIEDYPFEQTDRRLPRLESPQRYSRRPERRPESRSRAISRPRSISRSYETRTRSYSRRREYRSDSHSPPYERRAADRPIRSTQPPIEPGWRVIDRAGRPPPAESPPPYQPRQRVASPQRGMDSSWRVVSRVDRSLSPASSESPPARWYTPPPPLQRRQSTVNPFRNAPPSPEPYVQFRHMRLDSLPRSESPEPPRGRRYRGDHVR